jgi:hypothetical protein
MLGAGTPGSTATTLDGLAYFSMDFECSFASLEPQADQRERYI